MSNNPSNKNGTKLAMLALLGAGLVFAGGFAHGSLSRRWGPGGELVAAAKVVEQFPEVIGPWKVVNTSELEEEISEVLQCAGHVSRTYRNSQTGEEINLAIIVGPPGPTAVHTPEICYSSRDYTMDNAAPRNAVRLSDSDDTFWSLQFGSKRPGGASLRVYYGWSDDGTWQASDYPRYAYAGSPYLYKLQLATEAGSTASNREDDLDAGERFLEDLLTTDWRPTTQDAQL